jgi:RNA polymerase sigma-B factor
VAEGLLTMATVSDTYPMEPWATRVQSLLLQYAGLPAGHPRRAALRDQSIEAGLPLARRLATRYAGRGEPLDDLVQVAALALVKVIDSFDIARGTAFAAYAVPTILGALKRHFRDATWRVRVPRRIQELAISVGPASASLAQQLGRSPTRGEIAAHLRVTEGDVAAAIGAWYARCPISLDGPPVPSSDDRCVVVETIGADDPRFDVVTDWHALGPLLAELPARQQRIIALRFGREMTQAEIADRVGVSQMHVSRLLTRTLAQLRSGLLADV